MYITIAINEPTRDLLRELQNHFKEKENLAKSPAATHVIKKALELLKKKEGVL